MKVFFYLVPRETATQVHKFAGDNGETLQKTKVGQRTGNVYRPLISASTGRLKTGLNELVDNPYKDLEKEQIKSGFEPYVYKKEKIKLQHLLEYKHGVEADYYTDKAPAKEVSGKDDKDNTPYFQLRTTKVTLTDTGMMLDTDKPEDELKYYFLKASDKCAPSLREANSMKHEYYIGMENEDIEVEQNKAKLEDKAISSLVNEEISDDYKIKIVKVLGLAKKDITTSKAYMLLRSYVTEKHKDKEKRVKEYLTYINGYSDPKFREKIDAQAFLADLVAYRIVANVADTYTWKSTNINMGFNKAAAVEFILDANKQEHIDALEKELKERQNR